LDMDMDMVMARGVPLMVMDLELPPLRTATTCGDTRLLLDMESARATPATLDPPSPSPSSTLELLPLKSE